MNPISENLVKGTLGELLVQARLLCYGVQAAPPLKDSGNDLIAVRRNVFRAIQVKTTQESAYTIPKKETAFHILAAIQLWGEGQHIDFQNSKIYLIPDYEVYRKPTPSRQFCDNQKWEISQELVDYLFREEE